jgi:hypothetical protein
VDVLKKLQECEREADNQEAEDRTLSRSRNELNTLLGSPIRGTNEIGHHGMAMEEEETIIHTMEECSSWIDYFELYPEGPTIILHSDDPSLVKHLVRIFSGLADGRRDEADLRQEVPVVFSPRIRSLTLRATLDTQQPRKRVVLLATDPKGAIFEWRQSRAGWDSSASQLLPVPRVSFPSHQDFVNGFGSDALIVVSLSEYMPRNLEDVHLYPTAKRPPARRLR